MVIPIAVVIVAGGLAVDRPDGRTSARTVPPPADPHRQGRS
jgi:hypothetical protein